MYLTHWTCCHHHALRLAKRWHQNILVTHLQSYWGNWLATLHHQSIHVPARFCSMLFSANGKQNSVCILSKWTYWRDAPRCTKEMDRPANFQSGQGLPLWCITMHVGCSCLVDRGDISLRTITNSIERWNSSYHMTWLTPILCPDTMVSTSCTNHEYAHSCSRPSSFVSYSAPTATPKQPLGPPSPAVLLLVSLC